MQNYHFSLSGTLGQGLLLLAHNLTEKVHNKYPIAFNFKLPSIYPRPEGWAIIKPTLCKISCDLKNQIPFVYTHIRTHTLDYSVKGLARVVSPVESS